MCSMGGEGENMFMLSAVVMSFFWFAKIMNDSMDGDDFF